MVLTFDWDSAFLCTNFFCFFTYSVSIWKRSWHRMLLGKYADTACYYVFQLVDKHQNIDFYLGPGTNSRRYVFSPFLRSCSSSLAIIESNLTKILQLDSTYLFTLCSLGPFKYIASPFVLSFLWLYTCIHIYVFETTLNCSSFINFLSCFHWWKNWLTWAGNGYHVWCHFSRLFLLLLPYSSTLHMILKWSNSSQPQKWGLFHMSTPSITLFTCFNFTRLHLLGKLLRNL